MARCCPPHHSETLAVKLERCSLARQQVATATPSSDWRSGRRRAQWPREALQVCASRTCSMGCCPDNISAPCQFVQPAGPLGSSAGLSVLNGDSGGETKAFLCVWRVSGGGCQPRDNVSSWSLPEYTLSPLQPPGTRSAKSQSPHVHLSDVCFPCLVPERCSPVKGRTQVSPSPSACGGQKKGLPCGMLVWQSSGPGPAKCDPGTTCQ